MVHHHRYNYHPPRKGDEEEQQQQEHLCDYYYCGGGGGKKAKRRLFRLLFVFSLVSCSLVFGPRLLLPRGSSPSSLFFYSFGAEEENPSMPQSSSNRVPCSSVLNNTICCDRTSSFRTDVCVLKGDVRTRSSAASIFLYSPPSSSPVAASLSGGVSKNGTVLVEKIRAYTRKWETSVMNTVDELDLVAVRPPGGRGEAAADAHGCDVRHDVPAVVFSTGGYTGNVYHEFNDGLLPLYLTSHHHNRQVVFVILEYHSWWVTKYGDILSRLSAYPPVDFSGDPRTHCFPEATVGLRIHDELAVDPSLTPANGTILDFRRLLDDAYRPRIRSLEREEEEEKERAKKAAAALAPSSPSVAAVEPRLSAAASGEERPPKLVIISRNGSRGIENEGELVALCEEVGFEVEVLRPDRTTEMAKIYRALNASDAMIGVHGAAMTHFLFMRPGSVFIQVVPLGTDWAAAAYYGDPAAKMGLRYVPYKILPKESSLYRLYNRDDPVLRDPGSVTAKGWEVTKKVYLDGQNVKLDLNRFLKRLTRAYQHVVSKRRMDWNWNWSDEWRQRRRGDRRRRPEEQQQHQQARRR